MLRTTLIVIAWIVGIAAALAGAYFAYQKWADEKQKAKVQEWTKKQRMKITKEKINKGEVKESHTYGCASCQGRSTDPKVCTNCNQEIIND